MSEKKSYMNRKNILSENWIMDTLAQYLLFPSNFEKYKEKKLEKYAKKIEKIDKKIADLDKDFKETEDIFWKELEKSTGVKGTKQKVQSKIKQKLKHKR